MARNSVASFVNKVLALMAAEETDTVEFVFFTDTHFASFDMTLTSLGYIAPSYYGESIVEQALLGCASLELH